jgi:hypothetical protein
MCHEQFLNIFKIATKALKSSTLVKKSSVHRASSSLVKRGVSHMAVWFLELSDAVHITVMPNSMQHQDWVPKGVCKAFHNSKKQWFHHNLQLMCFLLSSTQCVLTLSSVHQVYLLPLLLLHKLTAFCSISPSVHTTNMTISYLRIASCSSCPIMYGMFIISSNI